MSRIFEIFTKTSDLKLVGKMTRNIFKMRLSGVIFNHFSRLLQGLHSRLLGIFTPTLKPQ